MSRPVVDLDPPGPGWASLIDAGPCRHADDRARFGIATDKPIVLAGHQGSFWHAGIAAKLFAAQTLADRIGGEAVWLVVDTDGTQPTTLRVPTRDEAGRLADRTVRLDRDTIDHPRAAAAAQAYQHHADEPSAAVRATLATMDLLPGPTPKLIRSSQLADSSSFGALVDRFRADPASARAEYNAALEAAPGAGMTPLAEGTVPFWRVTPSGARMPARDTDLESTLWPRALATTGVVRASLCDLFIHGTGGGIYEPINDRWLDTSLGWTLAPYATATATLRLRFEGDAVTAAQAASAAWAAHHARHHPGVLGDAERQAQRNALVSQIEAAPRDSARRARLFAELHAVLDAARAAHADAIDQLQTKAAALRERSLEQALRDDRTWPASLHDPDDLLALRDMVDARISGSATPAGGS